MRSTSLTKVAVERVEDAASVAAGGIPEGLSFFRPYLGHFLREILETGGEAYASRTSEGILSGLYIYDNAEKAGTIFTRAREVFDCFYQLRPFSFLYSELAIEREREPYDIFTIDLEREPVSHRFSHEISMARREDGDELERFMLETHPGLNRAWVRVALKNGDRCLTVRLSDGIAGVGWMSLVNGVGRVHALHVKPQFRRLGIGEDILFARLLWLKSNGARWAFSEISRLNAASARIATKARMRPSGEVFEYSKEREAPRNQGGVDDLSEEGRSSC